MKRIRIALVSFVVIMLLGLFVHWFVAIERIDAGCVGIKVNLVGSARGVADITECSGWVPYMPLFTEIHEFPIYTQVKDYEPFAINAKDGSEFTVDPTFSYKVNADAFKSFAFFSASAAMIFALASASAILNLFSDWMASCVVLFFASIASFKDLGALRLEVSCCNSKPSF